MHYVLERREAQKKTFLPVMSGDNVLSFVVKDLMLNGEYYFRVKAVNKIGSGEFLELRNPVITEEQKREYNSFLNYYFILYIFLFSMIIIIIINSLITEHPDPPIEVEGHNPTSNSVTVTWMAPPYDGGCPITGYILEKIEKDGDRFERCVPNLVPGFSYTVTGLTEGKEYQFRVRAENIAGASDPSRSTPLIKAADPVGMLKKLNLFQFDFE